jgi:acyl dehydratase
MNERSMSRLLCSTLYRNLIWWEDFKVGDQAELGRHTFTEQDIVAFGRQFDPQPFHTDKVAAQESSFGGLIASGWHTCAVGMRLMVERLVKHRWEAVNQAGELVLTMEGWGLFGRKN